MSVNSLLSVAEPKYLRGEFCVSISFVLDYRGFLCLKTALLLSGGHGELVELGIGTGGQRQHGKVGCTTHCASKLSRPCFKRDDESKENKSVNKRETTQASTCKKSDGACCMLNREKERTTSRRTIQRHKTQFKKTVFWRGLEPKDGPLGGAQSQYISNFLLFPLILCPIAAL